MNNEVISQINSGNQESLSLKNNDTIGEKKIKNKKNKKNKFFHKSKRVIFYLNKTQKPQKQKFLFLFFI